MTESGATGAGAGWLGGADPFGNPLAFGRQYRQYLDSGDLAGVLDPFLVRAIQNEALVAGTVNNEAKLESDGATKVPTVRNVALNPPYFTLLAASWLRRRAISASSELMATFSPTRFMIAAL